MLPEKERNLDPKLAIEQLAVEELVPGEVQGRA